MIKSSIFSPVRFSGVVFSLALGTALGESLVVPVEYFKVPEGLEVTLWAQSPMLHNPTNMDVDKDGRIWVAEGVNYRKHAGRRAEGDRIVVLEDTDGDGAADKSHTFVQEPFLESPLGVAVIDNKIVVSMTPDLVVYTDVDRDLKFDPAVDKREVLLSGFETKQHDHTLHSVTTGPDGQWYWNVGNCGGQFTDHSGKTFRIGSSYNGKSYAGLPSDDGHIYVGGFTARMNPDGSEVNIIGHNYRNSYEQVITSFGDVFQNDNDDPPACRVSHVLEYGNAGFSSVDGMRSWQADRRPGQSIPVAEWRQEDPGTMPSGDIYGGGSPTGVAFYENGALGEKAQGLLLSCEAGRNVVFGYRPKPEGAGFALDRTDFITSNTTGRFAGSDYLGGDSSVEEGELETYFRPADIVVGADGALYVADWFDPRVGGHKDLDDTLSGAIYRIAPKGFQSKQPTFDLETTEGQITALKSPAVNVRNLGYTRLKAQGAKAVPAVKALLKEKNIYLRARAVWLLSALGEEGLKVVHGVLKDDSPLLRTAAFRAVRRAAAGDKKAVAALALQHATDSSPMVRREVALAMRDIPFDQSKEVLVAVAKGFDGNDRSYLEALGTGATGKTSQLYHALAPVIGGKDALQWSPAFTWIAWRLQTGLAASGFRARAVADSLAQEDRKFAIDALAFIETSEAAEALLEMAVNKEDPLHDYIVWWLFKKHNTGWASYGILDRMKKVGLYDPSKIEIVEITVPAPDDSLPKLPPAAEIAKMAGNPENGKAVAARCYMCHVIDGQGIDYGPSLTDYGRTQTKEVIVNAITNPSSDIAHGFRARKITTTDGKTIHGLVVATGDPLMVKSTGGLTQTIAASKVVKDERLYRSLMLSAAQLGMTAQDVADVVAYLKSLGAEKK